MCLHFWLFARKSYWKSLFSIAKNLLRVQGENAWRIKRKYVSIFVKVLKQTVSSDETIKMEIKDSDHNCCVEWRDKKIVEHCWQEIMFIIITLWIVWCDSRLIVYIMWIAFSYVQFNPIRKHKYVSPHIFNHFVQT